MFESQHILAAQSLPEKLGDTAEFLTDTFGFDGSMIAAQMISFSILAFVLYKFAFQPILATMDDRQKKINEGLQYAEEMKNKLAETERKYNEKIKEGTEEAQRMINEAREHAKGILEKQTQESISQAEDIIKNAKQAAEYEHEKMLANVRKEVIELVTQTTAQVLRKELTEEERNRYSEAASKELYEKN